MSAPKPQRFNRVQSATLLAAAVSLVVAQPAAGAAQCPDAATVSAAQLIEFKTMMMVVGLRCKSVGIVMAEHNDDMAAIRSTMFEEADGRVRRWLTANDRPPPAPVEAPAPAKPPVAAGKALAQARPPASAAGKRPGVKGKGPARAQALAPTQAKPVASAAAKAPAVKGKVPTSLALVAAATAKSPAVKSKAAPRSRREDPYEKYLTRVGQTYGMGSSSLEKCRQFDTIAMWVADRTSPNRLLSRVAQEMIGTPMLERMVGCDSKS